MVPRELTLRSLTTGMIIGAALTPCNVYSGLKIGWSFNMSIVALLLAYGFWIPLIARFGGRSWTLLESNITQTSASSAASIISGGLVAPIPALALVGGIELQWPALMAWVFSVSFLGVWVAWYLRDGLIRHSNLAFPAGLATAATIEAVFAEQRAAVQRVRALLSSIGVAVLINAVDEWLWAIPRWSPSSTAQRLTLAFDPSLLMLGFGAIIGLRAGLGLLIGALIAWALIAPQLLETGILFLPAEENGFQVLVSWLIWPGVTLMVCASLTTLLTSLWVNAKTHEIAKEKKIQRRWPLAGFLLAAALVIVLQMILFQIHWTMAILAVPFAFALAAVAARVVGETGIAPIGAIGKVSQLGFGIIAPGATVTNLMTANVAGGAAGQCSDLMNDLQTGDKIGANPTSQLVAQCCGISVGSIVGAAAYLWLIPDPAGQLLTSEWPAPAVATWKIVAETLSVGLGAIPRSAQYAMFVAAALGISIALLENCVPTHWLWALPSGNALGLAFVVPAGISFTIFLGAAFAGIMHLLAPNWSKRVLLCIAAGLVAGESLFGIVALWFA